MLVHLAYQNVDKEDIARIATLFRTEEGPFAICWLEEESQEIKLFSSLVNSLGNEQADIIYYTLFLVRPRWVWRHKLIMAIILTLT